MMTLKMQSLVVAAAAAAAAEAVAEAAAAEAAAQVQGHHPDRQALQDLALEALVIQAANRVSSTKGKAAVPMYNVNYNVKLTERLSVIVAKGVDQGTCG